MSGPGTYTCDCGWTVTGPTVADANREGYRHELEVHSITERAESA